MIIGIDLGTTNSLVAYFTEKGAEIIPNRLGEKLTPSVVSLDEDGQVYVGKIAKERMITNPSFSAEVFKRSMGSKKRYTLGNREFLSEELSAMIIKSLKEEAEVFLGEKVEEAIISVPAYFNDTQRKTTQNAGKLAGLKVNRMISEPTAAALAYGVHQRSSNSKFMVFDLGGGTFDVSVLEMNNSVMEVRAVAGDNFLGGEDFTRILINMFFKKTDIDESKLDSKTIAHIKKEAEKCKISFFNGNVSWMKCKINEEIVEVSFESQEYEKCCELLLERIRKPIERALRDAKIKVREIDEILLVGGATKLKILRNYVAKLFGRVPNSKINPDEVVALGAAIQGAMKERDEAIKELILTDVCPYTLGTEVVVTLASGRQESGHYCPIIERNTVIPVSRTERLFTADDFQSVVRVGIYQGESRFCKNNIFLGEVNVPVPKKSAGEESIDVTYTYDINSILEVEVKVVSTELKKRVVIQRNEGVLTDEEIEEKLKELEYLKIPPRSMEENQLLLARGERLYEESLGEIRNSIERKIIEFERVLSGQDRFEIDKERKNLKDFFDEIEEL